MFLSTCWIVWCLVSLPNSSVARRLQNQRDVKLESEKMLASLLLALPSSAINALQGPGGYAIVEDFLRPEEVEMLRQDVKQLQTEGRFGVAGVGDGATKRVEDSVRLCEQCFLTPKIAYAGGGDQSARKMVYSVIDDARASLEEGTGVPLDGILTEALYAHYPNGGYYRRHIDSTPGTPQENREFSFLIYGNKEWSPGDGGHLRIHTDGGNELAPAGASPSFVDVEPRPGTLVVFRSDVPHEVLDTNAERLAVVGWFNSPPSGTNNRRKIIAVLGAAVALKGAQVAFSTGKQEPEK